MNKNLKHTYMKFYREKAKASKLLVVFWVVAVILGALYTWVYKDSINSMGIAYLDIAEAYIQGDWNTAINAYWSPLYSWLLGFAILILKPSPYWEFPVVHLVNFVIYLLTLISFHFLLREIIVYNFFLYGHSVFPKWFWLAFGYALFLWSSLFWITLKSPTPDMCVSGFVYLAFGLILQINKGIQRKLIFIWLGVVLGFAYLAKAAMFPLALIFIGTAFFSLKNRKKAVFHILFTLIIFLFICSPFIFTLSRHQGHFTLGTAGKLNYAWIVNGVRQFHHWQGYPLDSGKPKHPTRKISEYPIIYEFATPIKGTYPPWYDPSYWYEGLTISFHPKKQLQVILSNLQYNLKYFGFIIISLFTFNFIISGSFFCIKNMIQYWILLIPSIAALSMYSLVSLQPRYIAPFMVIFIMCLFSSGKLPDFKEFHFFIKRMTRAVFFLIIIPFFTYSSIQVIHYGFYQKNTNWQIAVGLSQLGIKPGETVVFIGANYVYRGMPYDPKKVVPWLSMSEYWARLARLRIIAEMDYKEDKIFWKLEESQKRNILRKIEKTGTDCIVAKNPPLQYLSKSWKKIGKTNYFVHIYPMK